MLQPSSHTRGFMIVVIGIANALKELPAVVVLSIYNISCMQSINFTGNFIQIYMVCGIFPFD